jgi:hypothetical protein
MHGMHGKASDFDCFREVIIKQISGDIVVYAVKCNESNTSDGIPRGGERAVNEVDNLLSTYSRENCKAINVQCIHEPPWDKSGVAGCPFQC